MAGAGLVPPAVATTGGGATRLGWSVERPGWLLVRKLADGVGDPAPHAPPAPATSSSDPFASGRCRKTKRPQLGAFWAADQAAFCSVT